MTEQNKEQPPWSPEWEQRYLHVQGQYDKARGIGVDILKLGLGIALMFNVIPMLYMDEVKLVFPESSIYWLYGSWLCILLTIIAGLCMYYFLFEGYFNQAHLESERYLSEPAQQTKVNERLAKSNYYFWWSLKLGRVALGLLCLAIVLIIIPIAYKVMGHICVTLTAP